MQLYICGDPNRSSRYTSVPHAEVGAPHNRWTVYINPRHTDYVPLSANEAERAARVLVLGHQFGIKPIRRVKPDERKASGSYTLYLVRVPKDSLAEAPAWDGTFIEQESTPSAAPSADGYDSQDTGVGTP